MPILRFKAVETDKLVNISTGLIDELEKIVQCPRDYFTLEISHSVFVMDGEIVNGSPVVEVAWFDRGQEIQDEVARSITKRLKSAGYTEVTVMFTSLEKNKYYENGEHF